jgi:hypothetical protein
MSHGMESYFLLLLVWMRSHTIFLVIVSVFSCDLPSLSTIYCYKGDMRALEDLTYERRREFLEKHHLPEELPVVSFRTEAGVSPAVLATLSHVAHAELPIVASAGESTKLPVVMPLGAAMAACAQLLQVRYGEKSDGLVTCRDAEVPGSIVVRPKRKLDHAWMVYSSLNDDLTDGDAAQVCEALLYLLVEVGQKKKHAFAKKDE